MIIKSLLDTDFYKFTISQYAWKYHRDWEASFGLINRSKNLSLDNIDHDQLRKELEYLEKLNFNEQEIDYLKSLEIFEEDYLNDLKNISLNEVLEYNPKHGNYVYDIRSRGKWWKATLAETFVLSIINELYLKSFESYFNVDIFVIHESSCIDNIVYSSDILSKTEGEKIITDFGTRRRASFDVQKYASSYMRHGSYFRGTSNVFLSRMYGTDPIGTYAHEIPMIIASHYIDHGREVSFLKQQEILKNWHDLYPHQPLIALSDTFGYKNFFNDIFTESLAQKWNGVRHDSGDPYWFADYVINFYKSLGINPKEKYIVFSDGLELNDIILINRKYKDQINVLFGWGTNLTNKGTIKPLSIVFKPIWHKVDSSENHFDKINRTVKLSDNSDKASPSEYNYPKLIKTYKNIFNYES